MSAIAEQDLAAAIAEARVVRPNPRLPPAGLGVRLRTSTLLRHAVPRRLAITRAVAKGERHSQNPHQRARAIASMEAILTGTPREGEIQELARAKLIEEETSRALFWQPWRTSKIDERSLRALERAFSSGRPIVVSACHVGPFFLMVSPLAARGISTIAVSGTFFFAEPQPGYWGRRLARWRKGCHARGERLVPAPGCFPVIKALAEQHEPVLIYFDMPGSIRTDFLGKPVMLASGTAQLAHQTDALVLPLRARRDGARIWTDVWDALDACDYVSPEELHRALAAIHERSILEIPEQWEDPRREGAWEDAATPTGWARPSAG
jgi:hypothetical protein